MDEAPFWDLIHTLRQQGHTECEDLALTLQQYLETRPLAEILAFDARFDQLMDRAYRQDLWAAAYIVEGFLLDDGFTDFRAWLIGQGEAVYTEAVRDPATLIDLDLGPQADPQCMSLLVAAHKAYEARTGEALPPRRRPAPELVGERWEEEDLPQMYPQLWARFYEDADGLENIESADALD